MSNHARLQWCCHSVLVHCWYFEFLYLFDNQALMLFVWSLQKDTLKYQINQLTWTIVSLLLVVGQSQFAIRYSYQGLLWILLPHGLIIVNDSKWLLPTSFLKNLVMAYFCGIALGRRIINRPLFELSPKKTWEGFFGALICTVCAQKNLSHCL